MKGAALLRIDTYEEVESDQTATGQAAGVVALVAVAQAIGGAAEGGFGILSGVLSALLGWLLWAGITYLIGAKLFGGQPPGASCSAPSGSRKLQGCSTCSA